MTGAREPGSHSLPAERTWSIVAGATAETARPIGTLHLVDLSAEVAKVRALNTLLNEQEQARAARFHFENDRARYIIGRARLRQYLARTLAIGPERICFEYGSQRKPRLSAVHESGLQFNLSHSGRWGLIGLTQARDIGVDIEEKVSLSDMDDLAARVFSEYEHAIYRAAATDLRAATFYNCWTRKEAFVKAVGDGLTFPLRSFDVSLEPSGPARLLRIEGPPAACRDWLLAGFDPAPDFAAAVVVSGQEPFAAVVASD